MWRTLCNLICKCSTFIMKWIVNTSDKCNMEIPQGWHLPSSSWVSRAPRPPFNICIWFKSPSTPSFQLSCHAWRTKLDLCQVNPFSSPIYLTNAENSWCTLTMTNATRECFRKEGIRLRNHRHNLNLKSKPGRKSKSRKRKRSIRGDKKAIAKVLTGRPLHTNDIPISWKPRPRFL